MMNTNWKRSIIILFTMLLLGLVTAVILVAPPQAQAQIVNAPAYETAITVDSSADPDTSKSYTCSSPPADGFCTLRRAIVEARTLSASELPVLIRFTIPITDSGYVSSLHVWKITVHNTTDTAVFRRLTEQITIDGRTQPNGRASGPKIVVVGPGTGNKDGLIVGDIAGDDNIQIYGLAFQNFKTHMYVNTNNNIIEEDWFGLNDAGTAPYLRNDDPEDGSGNAAISFNGNPMNNTVRNNVFLGFDGTAVAIRGDNNLFEYNFIGVKADGTVDKQTDPNLICTTVDWLGGGGITVEGDSHQVSNNTFAGLRQEIFQISTQPPAISVDGDHHVIQSNRIGVDGDNNEVGVCGRGIYLAGADTPDHTQISLNTIVDPQMSAVSINGMTTDANTLSGNVIKKTTDWPQIQGNPEPEAAIQFGATVPDVLRDFVPAQVTNIDGTAVSGTSGTGSPCPNCTIELFLDDTDTVVEALQLLVTTTADSSGNWLATLPFALNSVHGIRTTSATATYNTIPGMNAGTTTKLSELYTAESTVFLPLIVR